MRMLFDGVNLENLYNKVTFLQTFKGDERSVEVVFCWGGETGNRSLGGRDWVICRHSLEQIIEKGMYLSPLRNRKEPVCMKQSE